MNGVRRQALLSALLFLAVFAVYLHGLSPAFHPDDSAETITAGATLSMQHPPGYPLHSLLGRLAVMGLPGNPAFQVNLLAALFGALAALGLAWVLAYARDEVRAPFEKTGPVPPLSAADAAASLVAAFSQQVWFQSSIAKGGLYALNLALTMALLLCLLAARRAHARQESPGRWVVLGGLFFGLGMANHWTSQVVLLPGILVLALPLLGTLRKPGPARNALLWSLSLSVVLFVAGFSLYLYLPLRSLHSPPLVWGDPTSLAGMLWIFFREQYASIEASKTWANFVWLMNRIAGNVVRDLGWVSLAVLGFGWLWLAFRRLGLAVGLLLMPLTLSVAVAAKANPPADAIWIIDPYLLPVHAGAVFGLAGLGGLMSGNLRVTAALFFGWAALLALRNAPLSSQRGHFLAWDYIKNLNLSCPKDAVVFCEGDSNTAGPFAMRFTFGQRKDLSYLPVVLSDYPWQRKNMETHYPDVAWPPQPMTPPGNMAWISANNPKRPMVATNSFTPEWHPPKSLLPRGLVMLRLSQNNEVWPVEKLDQNRIHAAYATRGVFDSRLARDALTDRLVTDNYVETRAHLAAAYMDAKAWKKAEAEYMDIAAMRKDSAPVYIQAGNAAHFDGRVEDAGAHWKRAVELEPKNALAMANVALYYFQKREWTKAKEWGDKALAIDPGMANAKEISEKAAQQLADPQPAQGNTALQIAAKADQLGMAGQYAQALKLYRQAASLGLQNANLYRNASAMQAQLKDFPGALKSIDQALALNPNSGDYLKLKGIYLSNVGKPVEALQYLEKAKAVSPNDASLEPMIQRLRSALGQP